MVNYYGRMPLKIKFNSREFDKKLKTAIQDEINQALIAGRAECEDRIKVLVGYEFARSPEAVSMIAGKLKAEFGFGDGASFVEPIIQWIVSRIKVFVSPYRFISTGRPGGGYRIKLAVFDLDMITRLPTASYLNDVNYFRDIEWLRWLLSFGSTVIIKTFEIEYNFNASEHVSRSGRAIMVPGRGWRVPSEFAGTIDNNWITQTFDVMEPNILQIMENSFTKHLS